MVDPLNLSAAVRLRLGTLDLAVDLEATGGETVVVLGPNGAGKTTFLRALAGLVALDGGRIALGDLVLDDPATDTWIPTEQRPIGFVFQDHLLFPHLSALDNVAFGLRARGHRRAAADRAARHWLDRLDLLEHAASKPAQLSGGQAQRVALARTLAVGPDLLLLDEPLAALDATTRIEVRRALRQHLTDFAGPRIVVTHDPLDAMALGDRVVVVESGRVVQAGTLADLRNEPRSRYVADLVGVNLYRGRVRHDRFELGDTMALAIVNDDGLTGDAIAVVRPHAVALHHHAPEGSALNVWQGTVGAVDDEGERARVRVDARIPITAEITARSRRDLELAIGDPIWISVKATEIELFAA